VVGAKEIYFAAKASSTRELAGLRRALDEMTGVGVVGDVSVRIVERLDEYLFGEEKELLNVIEAEGPFPREAHHPPYERGLYTTPTAPNPALVNNVGTFFAQVSTIVRHGADSFRRPGTSDTPGTILVTLSGDITRPGVYEVETGILVRTLL
jgi:NADH-quinone oxidoreductase subunit F